MPYASGTYSLPPGSYGAPNTKIQSSKYNAVIDDLAAANNVARPISAGGTGATNATVARANLGILGLVELAAAALKASPVGADSILMIDSEDSNKVKRHTYASLRAFFSNASLLSSGTVADALLPATMSGKAFTSAITFGSATRDPGDLSRHLDLYGGTYGLGVSSNWLNITSANAFRFVSGSTIVASVSGAGNASFNGQVAAGSFSGPGTGLTSVPAASLTGTVDDARLPATMSGKGFSSGINFGSVAASAPDDLTKHIRLFSTSVGFSITTNALNFVAGSSNTFQFVHGSTVTGTLGPGGNLSVNGTATASQFNGSGAGLTSLPAGNLTGTVDDARLPGTMSGKTFSTGISFSAATAVPEDLSGFISFTSGYGIGRMAGRVLYQASTGGGHRWYSGGVQTLDLTSGGSLVVTASVTATGFNGSGANLTSVDAATLGGQNSAYHRDLTNSTGTLPAARFSDTSHGNRAGGTLHPAVTTSVNGFMSAADKTKLDGISAGAQVNPSAATVLAQILTVDGAGSGLDADTLDGQNGTYYSDLTNSTGTLPNARLTGDYSFANLTLSGTLTGAVAGNASTATTATNCSRSVLAGNGLTGGGQMNANRTLAVGQGTGIVVNAADVAVAPEVWRDGAQPTTAQIDAIIASTALGAIGCYACVKPIITDVAEGATSAGSNLRYSNSSGASDGSGSLTGTWRNMGRLTSNANASVFLRIA